MNSKPITVTSRIDGKTFRDFAVFDILIRQKRWKSPAIFAGIMIFFAVICFTQIGKAEQAGLLGGVLAGIGLILPAVYFGNFFYSIKAQIKKLKLDTPKHVYTVTLTEAEDGITIVTPTGEGGTLRVRWDQLHMVYQAASCIYLFISPRQAFLLPSGQADVSDEALEKFLKEKLPQEKWSVINRKNK